MDHDVLGGVLERLHGAAGLQQQARQRRGVCGLLDGVLLLGSQRPDVEGLPELLLPLLQRDEEAQEDIEGLLEPGAERGHLPRASQRHPEEVVGQAVQDLQRDLLQLLLPGPGPLDVDFGEFPRTHGLWHGDQLDGQPKGYDPDDLISLQWELLVCAHPIVAHLDAVAAPDLDDAEHLVLKLKHRVPLGDVLVVQDQIVE